ncbi:MAG: caspase family protein [Rubrivivax sp.]|nr:caspase family protein [Rubrivivax sp.]
MIRNWSSSMLPWLASALVLCGLAAQPARADTHALILWVGDYPQPGAKLRGVDVDARLAREMAVSLGARAETTLELSDAGLTFDALMKAWQDLQARVRPGDRVFIYFSGHGKRLARAAAPGCREGLVTADEKLYLDALLQPQLESLARKAAQVIMFNDSCFSGGAATKQLLMPGDDDIQAKSHPGETGLPRWGSAAAQAAADACEVPSNRPVIKAPPTLLAQGSDSRLLYLAASAEHEVAWSTSRGSLATRAWHQCLRSPETDLNGDGFISGDELASCATPRARRNAFRQTVTVRYNASLPLARAPSR